MPTTTGGPDSIVDLSVDQFRAAVSRLGFSLENNEQAEHDFLAIIRSLQHDVRTVLALPEYTDPRLTPNLNEPDPAAAAAEDSPSSRSYVRPVKAENPCSAWSHRISWGHRSPNEADPSTLLAGRSVALKDTICVAGVPVTCGTVAYNLSSSQPYPIPSIDAPVVTRVLEAGGRVEGLATCENYCISLASFTSATGPVENPWLEGHSAGGSSSGCAALLALKAMRSWRERRGLSVEGMPQGVDFAVGGDQAGSIRAPASFCGIYGLKPTHGLVPYTGILGSHPMIDTCGPMAGSLQDIATLLTVIAGYDGIDPRMTPETPLRKNVPRYHGILQDAIRSKKDAGQWTASTAAKGLRIGIVKESFTVASIQPEVETVIRKAAARYTELGATVEEVSIPMHALGRAIWVVTNRGHMADAVFSNKSAELLSHPLPFLDDPPIADQAWLDSMIQANPAVVNTALFGSYFSSLPHSVRSKSIMHVHQLRAAYDAALETYDVLLLPATSTVAPPHASPDASVAERYKAAVGDSANLAPFSISGHPALSMPVGWADAMTGKGEKSPVGMQIVGKRWDESGVLLAAAAWEVGGLGLDDI